MRRIGVAISTLVVVLFFGVTALSAQEELGALAQEIEGQVDVSINGGDWVELREGDAVPIDSRISTGFGSRAVLAVGDSAVITVEALTRMAIEELVVEEGVERSSLNLEVGRIQGEVERTAERPTEFEVRSPVATASVRGTSFSFDGDSLTVTGGVVSITNAFGRERLIVAGEQSETDGYSAPAAPADQRARQAITSPYTPGGDDEEAAPPDGEVAIEEVGPATLIIEFVLE